MRAGQWGKSFLPEGVPERVSLPEGSLLVDYVAGGGGFGDPIDRDPQAVLKDFGRGWLSRAIAERIYGVILSADGKAIDGPATEARRSEIRDQRRRDAQPVSGKTSSVSARQQNGWRRLLKFHAALEISTDGKQKVIRCARCGHLLCNAAENYKLYALHRVTHLSEVMPPLPSGEPYIGHPLSVAELLADLRLEPETIAAALLHDVLEDNKSISTADLERDFGPADVERTDRPRLQPFLLRFYFFLEHADRLLAHANLRAI